MKQFLGLTVRRSTVFAFDLVAIGIAFIGAFLLRFDFKIPPEMQSLMWKGLPWIYAIQVAVFITQGLYRGLWAFASIRDLFLILRAATLSVVLSVATIAILWNHLLGWPRSIFVLDAFLLILILGGGRFTYRFGREVYWSIRRKRKRILVIGAGQSANLIAREFSSRPELSAQVVGFLDDNPKLTGFRVQGATVLGALGSLDHWIHKLAVQEIIIAIPSLSGNRVREILDSARAAQIPCRICPPIRDVLLGRVELNQLREVRVEDLLRRDVVTVDDPGLGEFLSGRRILITGAGGSIGSELCRQVLKYNPAVLILFERSEYNLYRLEQDLNSSTQAQLAFVVGDILDERRVRDTFEKYQPEVVLHAAAYKHVPLMEENIYEALLNNVVGTYRLVTASAKSGVKNFVMISTDKAVRPTSVMGATKRMAELVTHAVGSNDSMKTAAVRFGNVLDSEGSVLPLFRDQIARGGPVTVTHPEVTRYFMTIPEASQLVLQASLLGQGGEVFLLDMGEPVLIRELAEELIKLSGFKPYEDIDIAFTGLRKGEKLYEELLVDMNHAKRTSHPKIMVSSDEHSEAQLPSDWKNVLTSFISNPSIAEDEELLKWVQSWVLGYTCNQGEDQPSPSSTEPQYLH